jgi:hypothetical protein
MGCHLREHRWQKLRLAIIPMSWSALCGRLWRADKASALNLAIAAIVAVFGGLQALGTLTGPSCNGPRAGLRRKLGSYSLTAVSPRWS